MWARRLAAALGLLLVLTAVWAVHSLRHGSFAVASGIDPLAADSVRIGTADGAARTITSRDDVLELIACLDTAVYTRQEAAAVPEDGDLILVFCRKGKPMVELRVGRALTVNGRSYSIRGLDRGHLRALAGPAR